MSFVDSLNRLLGDPTEKELKKLWPRVQEVKKEIEALQNITKADLLQKTDEYKARATNGESLEDLVPEAFAL